MFCSLDTHSVHLELLLFSLGTHFMFIEDTCSVRWERLFSERFYRNGNTKVMSTQLGFHPQLSCKPVSRLHCLTCHLLIGLEEGGYIT
jgi:hypothetical protein